MTSEIEEALSAILDAAGCADVDLPHVEGTVLWVKEVRRKRDELDAEARRLRARVEALEAALREVLDNDCYHPENLPEGDERCRRARAALEGK